MRDCINGGSSRSHLGCFSRRDPLDWEDEDEEEYGEDDESFGGAGLNSREIESQ